MQDGLRTDNRKISTTDNGVKHLNHYLSIMPFTASENTLLVKFIGVLGFLDMELKMVIAHCDC